MSGKHVDWNAHIGEKWGRLTIVKPVDVGRGRTGYECKCDCGNTVIVTVYQHLSNHKKQSCGCIMQERIAQGNRNKLEREKHSEEYARNQRARAYIRAFMTEYREEQKRKKQAYTALRKSNHRLYYIWQSMKQRCNRHTHSKYHNYGGRGIMVCEDWNRFEGFLKWARQNGYEEGLSIDRIDTNGNYEPSNCRWVDNVTQQNNKRNNCWLERDGEIHTLAEWARILNLSYGWLKESWEYKGFKKVEYEKKS